MATAKKRKTKADSLIDKEVGNELEEPPKNKKVKKALDSRFGGRTEEEIMELFLPDHLQPNLDVVFVCLLM